ncbi:uncharacterized protein GGS22DRAFT_189243 [Annulohypoxylon maeteangense]|uniref:uncharacterized protein n=1 Tax=Annulohypoxylon maeteangense TaxID=1927788 RepID=UPI0020078A3C|nr:uncharacterized protein GGS22DRAFT_189243 [Annulohypoxylon maeteangense]KAI0884113.1 hypothetical protein GGS22DRAFT_189243 [Annulohypoxylon maeteangense]
MGRRSIQMPHLAKKLGIPPEHVVHIKRFRLEDTRSFFIAMFWHAKASAYRYIVLMKSKKDERLRSRITREIQRRLKAAINLKEARFDLCRKAGKDQARKGPFRIAMQPTVDNPSKPRPIWRNTELNQWINQEASMNHRQLSPSFESAVSIHSKPIEEWDPWSGTDMQYAPRDRALVNNTLSFYNQMRNLSIPREIMTSEDLSNKEQTTTGKIKYIHSDHELRKFNGKAVKLIQKYFVSKGKDDEARGIKKQHSTMDTRDFAARANAVAKKCCMEMYAFDKHINDSTIATRKRLKKRAHEIKNWNGSRVSKGRGKFKGLAGGRPSPLRTSISVTDLEDHPFDAKDDTVMEDTEMKATEPDWGAGGMDIDLTSVNW